MNLWQSMFRDAMTYSVATLPGMVIAAIIGLAWARSHRKANRK